MLYHQKVNTNIEHLERLSRAELRIIWERELAEKPPLSLGRDILALGIAYARQENAVTGDSQGPSPRNSTGCWRGSSVTTDPR